MRAKTAGSSAFGTRKESKVPRKEAIKAHPQVVGGGSSSPV